MKNEFYQERLNELKELVECTEIFLSHEEAPDDLINLMSFRARVKDVFIKIDEEVKCKIKNK